MTGSLTIADTGMWIRNTQREVESIVRERERESQALHDLKRTVSLSPLYMLNEMRYDNVTFEVIALHFAQVEVKLGPTGDYGLNRYLLAQFWRKFLG